MRIQDRVVGSVLVFFFLFSGLIYAQNVETNKIFVLDDFSRGLNTKLSPFNLPKNQATVAENIRFDSELGSITKRDKTLVDADCGGNEVILGLHRLYLNDGTKVTLCNHGDEVEKKEDSESSYTSILDLATSDRRWSWITWHNIAIGTDGYNQPVKYDGTSASATYLGSLLATDAGSGAGPDGTYTYKVTCYTTSYEYSLDQPSNPVTVSDNDITLTMIPICPDTILGESVTGRKIYRIEDGNSTYKLLSNGTIADNSTVTLTDSDADGALGAAISPTTTRQPPKGKYILVHRNRLWIANNPSNPSTIYYSADASHDYFDIGTAVNGGSFNIRPNDGDEITAILNQFGKLTISKNNTWQKLNADGDTPSSDWAISDPFSFVGCQAPYSAVNSPLGIMYLGNNGIYTFNGQYSQLISDAVTPVIRDIQPTNYANVWAAFFKNSYYMAYTSEETGSTKNDRVLVFDTLSDAYNIDSLNINVFKVFDSGTDIEALYSGSSANGNVYAHDENIKEIVHKTHDDFTGTFDDMRYIPVSVGGEADDPVLEISWDLTIDEMAGTIDSISGVIDRPDTDGSYISQYLNVNASTFDKLYWNETFPPAGGDVTFAIRAGATTGDTLSAAWSTEFTNSAGSDISAYTADSVMQYRISMTTNDITQTPNLTKEDNYVIRLTYLTSGASVETTIPIAWESGWLDFGAPGYIKTLKKVYFYYEPEDGSTSTLNVTFENLEGDTDEFEVDLSEYPENYVEYFTGGEFSGEFIKIKISETSLFGFKFKRMIVVYDIEPLV